MLDDYDRESLIGYDVANIYVRWKGRGLYIQIYQGRTGKDTD